MRRIFPRYHQLKLFSLVVELLMGHMLLHACTMRMALA